MKTRIAVIIAVLLSLVSMAAFAADDYDARRARQYTREAEYYQRKAEGYRREAAYFLRKAEGYQRDAAYYTRKGDAVRAKDYCRKASSAMDDYKTQMKYAGKADNTAADYLRKAAAVLRK